jgi:hypothetical protein
MTINTKLSCQSNKSDNEVIRQIMETAYNDCNLSNDDFTADWLLSEFDDDLWFTTNKGREEFIDGRWKNTKNINFDITFSDGCKLTGQKYSNLLFVIKKVSFIIRSGRGGRIYGISRWTDFVFLLLNFTKWLVLHQDRFSPHKYEFMAVSQKDVDSLFMELSIGGWFYALCIPFRIIAKIQTCSTSISSDILKSPDFFDLNVNYRNDIIDWFEVNDYFLSAPSGTYAGFKYINRKKIAVLIDE